MSPQLLKRLSERLQPGSMVCEEIRQASLESLLPEPEDAQRFATAQSCKDVWIAYRRSHDMSFLNLVSKRLGWSQDVKRRIHKDRLNSLSALMWLVDDLKKFEKLVKLFRLEEEDVEIQGNKAFENIKVVARDRIDDNALHEIRKILCKKTRDVIEMNNAVEEAQQIFYPIRISSVEDTQRNLPRGRRLPLLESLRIYPTLSNVKGADIRSESPEKAVYTVRVVEAYLPPHSPTVFRVAIKKAKLLKVTKEISALTKIAQCISRPDSIMASLGAVRIDNWCYIFSELADCDLEMILLQQLVIDLEDEPPGPSGLTWPSYFLDGSLDIAKGLEWLHYHIPPLEGQPQQCFHLDLKPNNILVFGAEKSWIWKITDFGEASFWVHNERVISGEWSPYTNTTRPADIYQAPEVERHEVGRACDIWSFGCILTDILVYVCDPRGGVRALHRALENARETSEQERLAFYGREEGTGTPSLKREVVEILNDMTTSNVPWVPPCRDMVLELLQSDESARPSAIMVNNEIQNLFDHFASEGYSQPRIPKLYAHHPEGLSLSPLLKSFSNRSSPLWTKRYVSKVNAKNIFIAENEAWLIYQSSESIGSVRLTEAALWDNDEGLPQFQTLFPDLTEMKSIKFVSNSGAYLAILRDGASRNKYIIMVQHLGQETDPEKVVLESRSPPFGLSNSRDGHILVRFRDHVRLYCRNHTGSRKSYDKKLVSELETACFSGDGKYVYAWSVADQGPEGARSRFWYVWETASWITEDPPPVPLECQKPWTNRHNTPGVPCREIVVPLDGIPYHFDNGDPQGVPVLLHFLSFDDLGHVTLVFTRSGSLHSVQLQDRITGVYQACALLESHKPRVFLVRSKSGRGFRVQSFALSDILTSTWYPRSLDDTPKLAEVNMLTMLTENFDTCNISFVVSHSEVGSMAYAAGTEDRRMVVYKAKLR